MDWVALIHAISSFGKVSTFLCCVPGKVKVKVESVSLKCEVQVEDESVRPNFSQAKSFLETQRRLVNREVPIDSIHSEWGSTESTSLD